MALPEEGFFVIVGGHAIKAKVMRGRDHDFAVKAKAFIKHLNNRLNNRGVLFSHEEDLPAVEIRWPGENYSISYPVDTYRGLFRMNEEEFFRGEERGFLFFIHSERYKGEVLKLKDFAEIKKNAFVGFRRREKGLLDEEIKYFYKPQRRRGEEDRNDLNLYLLKSLTRIVARKGE